MFLEVYIDESIIKNDKNCYIENETVRIQSYLTIIFKNLLLNSFKNYFQIVTIHVLIKNRNCCN